jgi:DNA-binding NarL/FixJ family response regulator
MKTMRTGILDDHPLFVEGLSAILSNYPWIQLVFRGEHGTSLRHFLLEERLDLLFLDINL